MKLICFDVDGTLINIEDYVWIILNNRYNFIEQDKMLYNKHIKGEITYQEWVNIDFAQYINEGVNFKELRKIFSKYKPFEGVKETLIKIRKKGYKTVVLSGALDILLTINNLESYFDHVLINKIIFNSNGEITNVKGTPYDIDKRIDGLKHLCELENISLENTFYIGDGDNDIPMSIFMKKNGGTFIAFNPKSEELIKNAKYVVDSGDMRDILKYII